MTMPVELGRERGLKMAEGVKPGVFLEGMRQAFGHIRSAYPSAADLDIENDVRQFDAERLASRPDAGRFPELRGHEDRLSAERRAFREATGLGEAAAAFQFSWGFYVTRRLGSRHLCRYDLLPPVLLEHGCTNVFFPHGAEGVTISDNRDDVMVPAYVDKIPGYRAEGLLTMPVNWIQGGVSSSIVMDDEPACLFPASPFEYGDLVPPEARQDIRVTIEFLTRFNEFFGASNMIFCDASLRAFAMEKTNTMIAWRAAGPHGEVAVTACAYLDEAINAFKQKKLAKVVALRGETPETCPDYQYDAGSRLRYRRLVDLAAREAARPGGATLWGALEVVADQAVPFPARVCLAGEKAIPEKEPNANWTLLQHAAVMTGPRRRCLYRSVQDLLHPRPIYTFKPKLALAPGVAMAPEWEADIAAGRCELAGPVP